MARGIQELGLSKGKNSPCRMSQNYVVVLLVDESLYCSLLTMLTLSPGVSLSPMSASVSGLIDL